MLPNGNHPKPVGSRASVLNKAAIDRADETDFDLITAAAALDATRCH